MKLSAAIEEAITSGVYNKVAGEFMCLALKEIGQGDHVAAVRELVNSIHPNTKDIPLICALHEKGIVNIDDGSIDHAGEFAITKQLYCWWVFDLKRQGR